MRILEQLKLEWTGADVQAFRSMWMARMPIPDIAERLGCSAAEVALLVIDQAEKEIIGKWGEQMTETVETVNIYGETVRGKIIKENTNTVIVEGSARRLPNVIRSTRKVFDFKRVAAYGKAPDKRAIHHNNRGQKSVRGEK